MLSIIYEKQREKRDKLIKKLFEAIAQETIGIKNVCKVKLILLEITVEGCNWCKGFEDGTFKIGIEFPAIKKRTIKGYENCYYTDRKLRIDKYILHNKHNAIRFALYHELKHTADRIRNPKKEPSEFFADGWAIKHLRGAK